MTIRIEFIKWYDYSTVSFFPLPSIELEYGEFWYTVQFAYIIRINFLFWGIRAIVMKSKPPLTNSEK